MGSIGDTIPKKRRLTIFFSPYLFTSYPPSGSDPWREQGSNGLALLALFSSGYMTYMYHLSYFHSPCRRGV